jgi:hypothetical protein
MLTSGLLFLSFTSLSLIAGDPIEDTLYKKTNITAILKEAQSQQLCQNVIGRFNRQTNFNENYIFDKSLYYLKVDTLPQVKFWRSIMNLHEDSALINIAPGRVCVQKVNVREWDCKTDSAKKYYRDSIRVAMNLDSSAKILLTTGKRFFYDFDRASQHFQKGIQCFMDNRSSSL